MLPREYATRGSLHDAEIEPHARGGPPASRAQPPARSRGLDDIEVSQPVTPVVLDLRAVGPVECSRQGSSLQHHRNEGRLFATGPGSASRPAPLAYGLGWPALLPTAAVPTDGASIALSSSPLT